MRIGKIGILLMCCLLLTTGFSTAAIAVDWAVGGQAVGSTGQLGSTDNYDVQFITNNAVRMTITNTGDVGIGIATPSHKLHITDSDVTPDRAGLYVDQAGAITAGSGTGYGIYAVKTGASNLNVGGLCSASGGTNNLGFTAGATGGGTLNMGGEFVASGATSNYGLKVVTSGSATTNVGGSFSATGATNNYGLIVPTGDVGVGTVSPTGKFQVDEGGGTLFIIDKDGPVGIGLNSPINSLDVNSKVAIGSNYAGTYSAPTNGMIVEGDVGIGATDPQNALTLGPARNFAVEVETPGLPTGSSVAGGSLTQGQTYTYKVVALDEAGGETVPSMSVAVYIRPGQIPPHGSAFISWTGIFGAHSYRVYEISPTPNQYFVPSPPSATSITISSPTGTSGTLPTSCTAYVNKINGEPTAPTDSWFNGGRVGIGTASPNTNTLLHVSGTDLHAGYFTSTFQSTNTKVLYAEYIGGGNNNAYGVYGKSIPADAYGTGGRFDGGRIGVIGYVWPTGNSVYNGVTGYADTISGNGDIRGVHGYAHGYFSTGDHYGVYGEAFAQAGSNYGVYGEALGGSTNNYGVYGTILSPSTGWAGYFDNGNVYVQNNLGISISPQRDLHVQYYMRLEPTVSPPGTPSAGDMFFHPTFYGTNLGSLRVYDGTTWKDCW